MSNPDATAGAGVVASCGRWTILALLKGRPSDRHLPHLSARFLAAVAGCRARLAGGHFVVFLAFQCTGHADLRADCTDVAVKMRAARHETDALRACVRAVTAEPDTFRHRCHLLAGQATIYAPFAGDEACLTVGDALLHQLHMIGVGH